VLTVFQDTDFEPHSECGYISALFVWPGTLWLHVFGGRYHWILETLSGHAVAQLVEALRYKPESGGFDSRWCHWNFSLISFRPHYGPGVDSASNRNEYQEYLLGGKGGRCVGLTTLPPLGADCLEIWEPQLPGTLRACPSFTFTFTRSPKRIYCVGGTLRQLRSDMIHVKVRTVFKNKPNFTFEF